MSQVLFDQGKTNLVSATFSAPAQLSLFNATADEHTFVDGIVTESNCGDFITFERVLFDGDYDVVCKGIIEGGAIASAPLQDEDGCDVQMNHKNNSLFIEGKGMYRAIYHGDNREEIILIKE
ncbi:hypothetical protein HPC38_02295 [Pasteurellaceae bacterium HPA106]|uniref:hypothetical protein n=1 Tax=Spirabiliibacterium pneumoniae TaxID=221400 RepID=UPI001AADE5B2|nr:hypothetical protein [Spirabiliibacterium pneumoniae]MBE2895709.1 hypothetical protein [Spirabiliibacterium pneumoniae]